MSGPILLLLTLWASRSFCVGLSPPQLDKNSAVGTNQSQATTTRSASNFGRSFYLTIAHRMKGDVPSDMHGHLYRHLGDYRVDSPQQCTLICLSHSECRSVSYKKGKNPRCHLHDMSVDDYVMLVKDTDWDIFSTYEGSTKNWTLVFLSHAGSGPPPYKIFASSETGIWKETTCSSADCIGTFKNSFIEHWSSLPIAKVKLVLSKESMPVVVLEFDGQDTNKTNWFSKKRLLSAEPWNDLFSEKQNYFSLEGEDKIYKRRFYINKGYGSCKGDVGWLLVRDSYVGSACDTESRTYPQFLYSPKETYLKRPEYAKADKMEIFINFK